MTDRHETTKDEDRFDELLPWYVNGTLPQDERTWMDAFVQAHPEANARYRVERTLAATLQEEAAAVPADLGFAKLMQRVRQEQPAAPTKAGFLQRMNEALGEFFAGFRLTPAMGTAFAVILAQAGIIGALMLGDGAREADREREYAQTRSIDALSVMAGPFLRINFKPDTRESDMRLALVSVGGTLVGGPSQLGDYFVKVPRDRIEKARSELRANDIIESVDLIESLPTRG